MNSISLKPKHLRKFWQNINITEDQSCWEWTGSKTHSNYGHMRIGYKFLYTHRLSYMIHNLQDIPDGMCICHTCDNPSCVNPAHLFLGTYKDNTQDMLNKGRRPRSHKPHKARSEFGFAKKLIPDQVKAIRASNKSVKELASEYGVSVVSIRGILNRKWWKGI